jgi:hypothetical protein
MILDFHSISYLKEKKQQIERILFELAGLLIRLQQQSTL